MRLPTALASAAKLLLCTACIALLAMACVAQADILPQAKDSYFTDAQAALEARLATRPIESQAKNIILFIADGQGITTTTAARIYQGQKQGNPGEENFMALERYDNFPYLALSKTYNDNAQTGDSAGTMSAMVTGVKTKQGVLSIGKEVLKGDCKAALKAEATTVLELAETIGMSTGIISTARLTHATPAANYAHSADRAYEDDSKLTQRQKAAGCRDIARQLIELSEHTGNGIEVALGGGRQNFLPKSTKDPEDLNATGHRQDGRDLIREWQQRLPKSAYVWNKEQFERINPKKVDHLLGLFSSSHMEYARDRKFDTAGEPSLVEMTRKAIEILSKNPEGFYLQVESGRVDHAHHGTNAARALEDAVAFDEAIAQALKMTNLEDTLIIVTADHSHTLTISGYGQRGNPILGLVQGLDDKGRPTNQPVLALDGKPYPVLSYANGPSAAAAVPRPLTDAEATKLDALQPSLVPLPSETHGGEDVAIYARGPWAHLFQGTVEQNYIFHVMDYAAKLRQRAGLAG